MAYCGKTRASRITPRALTFTKTQYFRYLDIPLIIYNDYANALTYKC